jgi:hypothetical protein
MSTEHDGIEIEVSDDRTSVTVIRETPEGTDSSTTSWATPRTPEEIYRAVDSAASMKSRLVVGERRYAWNRYGFILIIDLGPPTWWLPMLKAKLGRDWFIHTGWLRIAVSFSTAKRRAPEDTT